MLAAHTIFCCLDTFVIQSDTVSCLRLSLDLVPSSKPPVSLTSRCKVGKGLDSQIGIALSNCAVYVSSIRVSPPYSNSRAYLPLHRDCLVLLTLKCHSQTAGGQGAAGGFCRSDEGNRFVFCIHLTARTKWVQRVFMPYGPFTVLFL